jgi:hypothetical protein
MEALYDRDIIVGFNGDNIGIFIMPQMNNFSSTNHPISVDVRVYTGITPPQNPNRWWV